MRASICLLVLVVVLMCKFVDSDARREVKSREVEIESPISPRLKRSSSSKSGSSKWGSSKSGKSGSPKSRSSKPGKSGSPRSGSPKSGKSGSPKSPPEKNGCLGRALVNSVSCGLPPEEGRCTNFQTRYYYDTVNRSCLPFQYGGCKGNDNNFKTQKACEYACPRALCQQEGCNPKKMGCAGEMTVCQASMDCTLCRCNEDKYPVEVPEV